MSIPMKLESSGGGPRRPADSRSLETRRHLTRSAGKLSLGILLSRFLGVGRDMAKAYLFGTGVAADAFTVAFRIPNILRAFFAEGTLSAAFVPVFGEYIEKRSKEEMRALVSVAWSVLAIVLGVVTILGVLLSPLIVRIMAPGFADVPGKMELTVSLTRMLFPYILFIGLATLLMGTLNSLRHFTAPALAPAVLNVAMIAAVLLVCPRLGPDPRRQVYGLAAGVLVGGALQVAIQVPFLRRNSIKLRFRPDFKHPAVGHILGLMIPGVIGLGVQEINAAVDMIFASTLRPGSVAALEYGARLMQLPLGIFGVAIGTAILPTLSRQVALKQIDQLRETAAFATRLIAFVMLPATIGLVLLRTPIVRLIFERGAFRGGSSVELTATALLFYSLGLVAYGGVKIVVPVFYSFKDMKTPVKFSVIAMLANVVLAVTLMQFLGLGGLALATALSSGLNWALHVITLRKRLGRLHGRQVARSMVRIGMACAVMAAATVVVVMLTGGFGGAPTLPGLAVQVGASLAVGMGTYLAAAWFLRCDELRFVLSTLKAR
jgi:putative peptidoglycan lipid II flippase